MVTLSTAFQNPNSRVSKAIFAIDITESTKMKDEQAEITWLNLYAWFFDLVRETLSAYNGTVVKYLGDGVMAVFPDDAATAAINCAIVIQEKLASARAKNLVYCSCSIGIATGDVVEFSPIGDDKVCDYIGSVVDKAFRLCSAANANAIFVDENTTSAAMMNRIECQAASSGPTKRSPSDYQGSPTSIRLKGFSRPVTYYEVLWSNARYSVKNGVVTDLSGQDTKSVKPPVDNSPPVKDGEPWVSGIVDNIREKSGIVLSQGDQRFYFNLYYIFTPGQKVEQGNEVWFKPEPPLPNAKHPRAGDLLVQGQRIEAKLYKVTGRGFGFAWIESASGHRSSLYVSMPPSFEGKNGDLLTIEIGRNAQGMAGVNPVVITK